MCKQREIDWKSIKGESMKEWANITQPNVDPIHEIATESKRNARTKQRHRKYEVLQMR